MTRIIPPSAVCLLFPIVFAACGEKKELIEQRDLQKSEIIRLHSELAALDSQLRSMPPDRSAELETLRQESERQEKELSGLQERIKELEERKRARKMEFDQYRQKYVVR